MDASPSTRGSVSPVTSQNATPRKNQENATTNDDMGKPRRSPQLNRNHELENLLSEDDSFNETDLFQQMEEEKIRYPGASGWAPAEERLFEILFMRQDLPLLPSNWDIDFSGVPISEVVFDTSDEHPPIIYAHGKDFRATLALMRLIDLTANVRTNIQTGFRRKVPRLIKRELDKYINWAAQDGEYAHLKIVPNIMVEIINTKLSQGAITEYMQGRMSDLATLQREFLRQDRAPDFWDVVKPNIMSSPRLKFEPEDEFATPERPLKPKPEDKPLKPKPNDKPLELRLEDKSLEPQPNSEVLGPQLDGQSSGPNLEASPAEQEGFDGTRIKIEPGTKRRSSFSDSTKGAINGAHENGEEHRNKKRKIDETLDKDNSQNDSTKPDNGQAETTNGSAQDTLPPTESEAPPELTYSRPPPVVYGLFILNTTVLLLTVDSSKGDSAYVSFHVQTNFQDTHQSVWNALTLAIAVCQARDELMGRKEDFEPLPVQVESDPDA